MLMTVFVAMIGLVPPTLGADETGKELLHPLAIVGDFSLVVGWLREG